MEGKNQDSLILVFASQRSERLHYILQYLFEQICLVPVKITTDPAEAAAYSGILINYSEQPLAKGLHIYPNGLLFETDIRTQNIHIGSWNDLPVFFQTAGDLLFDIFSASFYLISRYEEYLPHTKDNYGRYDHTNSIAFKHGFLHKPLVEQWMRSLSNFLHLPFQRRFTYLPSFDIDQAWSWKHKGFMRNAGGWLRDLLSFHTHGVIDRLHVLMNRKKDPFDVYDDITLFHQPTSIKPIFFFLLGTKNSVYDKQILPSSAAMKKLVRQLSSTFQTGIHPSWLAHRSTEVLKDELRVYQALIQEPARRSRYHYLAFQLPDGYSRLINEGIKEEYSMGYGTINGFRASTSIPFNWFDLSRNTATDLTIFPFCWMDANSYYVLQQTPEQAYAALHDLKQELVQTGGQMIAIWHNNFLGSDPAFKGWRRIYEQFFQESN